MKFAEIATLLSAAGAADDGGAADNGAEVDHVALAVRDLEAAQDEFLSSGVFALHERRETMGRSSGMVSAVLRSKGATLVLLQGSAPTSQVSRFIDHVGPGVHHIALRVRHLPRAMHLVQEAGVEFATRMIEGSGIRQIFTKRDPESHVMVEMIERQCVDGRFSDANVTELFMQLEQANAF